MAFRILLLVLLLLTTPLIAAAQIDRDSAQSGEIVLQADEKKAETFAETQDYVIDYFKKLDAAVSTPGVVPSPLPQLKDNHLVYLNAVYLYCTIASGTCPTILDAILESDVINARLKKEAQCPNLKLFWRHWIRNEMEQRQSFSVKTGYLSITEEFKKKERPKYIKCEPTVKSAIESDKSDAEYFSSRYSGETNPRRSTQRAVRLLEEIKEKVPNIISSISNK